MDGTFGPESGAWRPLIPTPTAGGWWCQNLIRIADIEIKRGGVMRRKTFDILASLGGVLVVAALVIAGALAVWGYNFANNNVHEQLSEQQITFPTLGSSALPARRSVRTSTSTPASS